MIKKKQFACSTVCKTKYLLYRLFIEILYRTIVVSFNQLPLQICNDLSLRKV